MSLGCEGITGFGLRCHGNIRFAVWYDKDQDSAKGACGKHLAQVTQRMLDNATQRTGQFVKVTGVR